jgi:hypothetical protein
VEIIEDAYEYKKAQRPGIIYIDRESRLKHNNPLLEQLNPIHGREET